MTTIQQAEKHTVQAAVVLIGMGLFAAVVATGLILSHTIQEWLQVAAYCSGFLSGILTAYGIFKAVGK